MDGRMKFMSFKYTHELCRSTSTSQNNCTYICYVFMLLFKRKGGTNASETLMKGRIEKQHVIADESLCSASFINRVKGRVEGNL